MDISIFTGKDLISGCPPGADVDPGVKVKTSIICKKGGELVAFLYRPDVIEILGLHEISPKAKASPTKDR